MTQSEFEEKVNEYQQLERTRPQLYDIGLKLIQSSYDIEAYLLILATWNFAHFRYVMKNFDLTRFRETISNVQPIFERLNNKDLMEVRLEDISSDIMSIYSQLKPIVKQTGASKLMHFKQPRLFVMWDTAIRAYYHIPQRCTAEDYFNFLGLMKNCFQNLHWNQHDKTFAKAIDEYNFVVVRNDEEND